MIVFHTISFPINSSSLKLLKENWVDHKMQKITVLGINYNLQKISATFTLIFLDGTNPIFIFSEYI